MTELEAAVHTVDTASVMTVLGSRPHLLALGEPTHGEEDLLELRNELFRRLVEQEGYRTIAIESDCMAGLLVDDFVRTGTGDLADVVERGISHEWGALPGNRALVRWMREYNAGRPEPEQVRFAGFDGPLEITHAASPRPVLTALHAYLSAWTDAELLPCTAGRLDELIGADERWTDPDAMLDPSRSVGRTPEAERLRLLAEDLAALLDTEAPHLITASSREAWDRARLYGRTATGLLRYHSWMADTSPARMAGLLGARSAMMAANLLALAEHGPVLIHAHNAHLQRERSRMGTWHGPVEWWSAGAIVQARWGDAYAFLATALGTLRHQGVAAPPVGTLEGLLYALPQDRCLVDARRLASILGDRTPARRESPWFGYAPLDPAHVPGLDGIVFVRDVGRP